MLHLGRRGAAIVAVPHLGSFCCWSIRLILGGTLPEQRFAWMNISTKKVTRANNNVLKHQIRSVGKDHNSDTTSRDIKTI
jgi:hypothetical protein